MPDSEPDSDSSNSSRSSSNSSGSSSSNDSAGGGSGSSSGSASDAGSSSRRSEKEEANVERETKRDKSKEKSKENEQQQQEEQLKTVDNNSGTATNVADTSEQKTAAKDEEEETAATTNDEKCVEKPVEEVTEEEDGKKPVESETTTEPEPVAVTTNGNTAAETSAPADDAVANSPSNVEEGEIVDVSIRGRELGKCALRERECYLILCSNLQKDDEASANATAAAGDAVEKVQQEEQQKEPVARPPQIASEIRRRSRSRDEEKQRRRRRHSSRSQSRSRSPRNRRRRTRTRSPRSRSVSPIRRRSSSLERRRVQRQKRHEERAKRDEERARERELRHRSKPEGSKRKERSDASSSGDAAAAGAGGASPVENADNSTVSQPTAKISERQRRTVDLLTSRTGGAYIPPAKLRLMQAEITDKASAAYQRIAWEALKKSIHGYINKVNVTNIAIITRELLRENIVRGRGLLCRSIIQAQAASPTFTHVYAALVAIINSKFPNIGELLLKRLVIQFRRAFRRNDKMVCMSATRFIGHLVNQRVAHEILALEMLTLLVEMPTDDSVEVAISFLKECGMKLTEVSSKGIGAIFEMLRNILHEGKLDRRVQYMIEVLFQVRKDGFKDHPAIVDDLELVEEDDQFTHLMMLDEATETEDILSKLYINLYIYIVIFLAISFAP